MNQIRSDEYIPSKGISYSATRMHTHRKWGSINNNDRFVNDSQTDRSIVQEKDYRLALFHTITPCTNLIGESSIHFKVIHSPFLLVLQAIVA